MVGTDREAAEREVVVSGGELVLVQHVSGAVGASGAAPRAAAVNPVLAPLEGAGEVLVGPWRTGADSSVSCTRPDDLLVELLAQRFCRRGRRLGVGVLGLEVGAHLGVVALPQPVPVVDPLVAVGAQRVRAPGRDRRSRSRQCGLAGHRPGMRTAGTTSRSHRNRTPEPAEVTWRRSSRMSLRAPMRPRRRRSPPRPTSSRRSRTTTTASCPRSSRSRAPAGC